MGKHNKYNSGKTHFEPGKVTYSGSNSQQNPKGDPRPDPDEGKTSPSAMLLKKVASILQIDLHKTAQGIRGFSRRTFDIGGAKVEADVLSIVDESNASRCTALCRIRKNLWLYVFVTESHSAIIAFDGPKAQLSVGNEGSFCTGSAMKTLEKIKAAATAGFRLHEGAWVTADLSQMLT